MAQNYRCPSSIGTESLAVATMNNAAKSANNKLDNGEKSFQDKSVALYHKNKFLY
jgi:hypothetical protein